MPMIETDRDPSPREMIVFACGVPLAFALVGAQRWHAGATGTAQALWIAAGVAGFVLLGLPQARRTVYAGWRAAMRPVAWLASYVAFAIIYFVVATPTALLLRALRRDPMQRGFDSRKTSYWTPRPSARARRSYFRQF